VFDLVFDLVLLYVTDGDSPLPICVIDVRSVAALFIESFVLNFLFILKGVFL
jgi:hypothetical protein